MNNIGKIQQGSLIDKYHMEEELNDSEINDLMHSQVLKLVDARKKSHCNIAHIVDPKLRKDLEESLTTWELKELQPKITTTKEIKDPFGYFPKLLREGEYDKYEHEGEEYFIDQKKDI